MACSRAQNETIVAWSTDDHTGEFVEEESEMFGQRLCSCARGCPPLVLMQA
jgi:hypothetical protein